MEREGAYPAADVVVSDLTPEVVEKRERMRALISSFGRVVVAYSGGVDSAFVLKVAHDVLGERTLALTARSASLMRTELEDAIALAREIGARHQIVDTRELDREGYVENTSARCYHCKTELFDTAHVLAQTEGGSVIVDGFNADDFRDHREGHRAAMEHGVRHPLAEVGLTKPEVRALSKACGLRTWKKPQLACLSSRLPYGVAVTEERLSRVEAVEIALRRLGFFDVRARLVRENDDMVRIELGEGELARVAAPEIRRAIVSEAGRAGFRFVTLDLEGFRSGRLADASRGELVRLDVKGPRSRSQ